MENIIKYAINNAKDTYSALSTNVILYCNININIKVGDTIRCVDGSSLTTIKGKKKYIIDSIKGVEIKYISGVVTKIHQANITNGMSNHFYLQDIIVRLKDKDYRINSCHVTRIM